MPRVRVHSAHSDMKTGFFCRFFLVLGLILLAVYLLESFLHLAGLPEGVTGALLAFAILCIGLGALLYFFACQFAKLSAIAEEIEADESLSEEEEEEHKEEKPTT